MDLTMSCSSLSLLFFISLHIHFLVPGSGKFLPFRECAPFVCGDKNISYPFRHNERPTHCGYPGYELGCDGHNPTLVMESLTYRVIHMNTNMQILEVARKDLSDDLCHGAHVNTTLNSSLFNYTSSDLNSILFYDCDSSPIFGSYPFSCPTSGDSYFAPVVDLEHLPQELCNFSVLVPISQSDEAPDRPPPSEDSDFGAPINHAARISEILNKGFEITWIANTAQCENCTESGGICGYDWKRQRFNCFCTDGAYSPTCNGTRVPGSFPSSMYTYSHLFCGFQLAKAVQ
ncbi:LEAF RUST 10 DISEASE-RESISTANCE LOCUS RECEPTOR-LIKE PROTEIN KINASE-like 1.3 [Syzygium oleosum]|uniref:LEAF RUST 10 DISEASE-RESISTANCE LOCUS RECEPTOR-LIKE PROTEIN KINASE-like 1.3 n=1 Tax=Syzygium oleosum TaxID=219896 RepID=UPI0024BB59C1|nr:LEAF RUST 10 DISEASE-RESISTANCE LOCUS RECEPTOR-LIKE PROTEIN KINASE-like 1.3 [Syzygium oleosum]